MIDKSGQTLSPCVLIEDQMLADVSGDEVESYLLANRLVEPTDREAEAPTHQCCGG
jgi:monothiol glutaredoxin